jgi:hypothetical protein
MASDKTVVFSDFRGGRNGADPPLSVQANECVEAYNVDFWQSTLGHKRGGSADLDLHDGPASTTFSALVRHNVSSGDFLAELWGFCYDFPTGGRIYKRTAAGVWSEVTALSGDLTADTAYDAVTFNGKLFIAAQGVSFLRVYDGTNLRKVGFATPSAPIGADDGSGTYAATPRYYKVAYTEQAAGVTKRRSELSAELSKTPSGSGANLKITRQGDLSNGETHWELYAAASSAGPYSCIATTAIATDHVHDSAVPTEYTGDQPPEVGTNADPDGGSYLCTDGLRLLMAAPYTSFTRYNRVVYTPVLGASDIGDDERFPPDNYTDLGESDGDNITGLSKKPLHGSIYVFKRRHIYKLTPTGNVDTPYQALVFSNSVGTVSNKSLVFGEDASGNEALYFMSERGPYRIGASGLEYLGRNLEDLDLQAASTAQSLSHSVYYPYKRQAWFYVPRIAADAQAKERLVYDVMTGGWSRCVHTASASCLYASTGTAGPLVPYVGVDASPQKIYICDSGTTDGGTAYQAYVTTPPKTPAGLLTRCSVDEPMICAKARAATVVTVTATADFGLSSQSKIVSLSPKRTETRVVRKVEGLGLGECSAVQYQIGDAAATDNSWSIDALVVPAKSMEPA